MLLRQVLEIAEILDAKDASGQKAKRYLESIGADAKIDVWELKGPRGKTDMIRIVIPGSEGKTKGGSKKTLAVLGRLGGIGARPERIGFVSDGDGALCALAVAAKLCDMQVKGDVLSGDVVVSTHICPDAPTQPHIPVPFMSSPVEMAQVNQAEMSEGMDAVLSIDTTKGNRIINHRGFAISPTVKEGYILRVSEDLLELMQIVTGQMPKVFPITQQDISPYGNGLYHMNSILQPATATKAPVVGVAITAETMVPGCATGASHPTDIECAGRFAIEVAKAFFEGTCQFYDEQEFASLQSLYGDMSHFQTMGKQG